MNQLPFLGIKLSLYSSSTAGIRNAKVFPDPVFAAPRISLYQDKSNGLVHRYISLYASVWKSTKNVFLNLTW